MRTAIALALTGASTLGSTVLPAMTSQPSLSLPAEEAAPEAPKLLVGFGASIDLDRAVAAVDPAGEAIRLVQVDVPRPPFREGPEGWADHCTPVVFTNFRSQILILETPEGEPEAAGWTFIDAGRAFGAFRRPAGAGYLCGIRPRDTIRIASGTLLPEREYRLRTPDGSLRWTVRLRFTAAQP